MWTRRWLSREMAMYERSGAPRRWESRTESEREGVRVAPGLGLVRDRVERVALLAMQSSPAPLPGDEVAGGDGALVVAINDDGRGVGEPGYFRAPPASDGLGLIGMRERIAHFGRVFR